MKSNTNVNAEPGKQEIIVTREFDLSVSLLFKAYTEPEIISEWMSHEYGKTTVKQENKKFGLWQFVTIDHKGNKVFGADGVILEIIQNEKITRTFKMESELFPVQLEFIDFEKLTESTSKLTMQMLFKSVAVRDQLLKMPFAQGLNMAHNRIQELLNKQP